MTNFICDRLNDQCKAPAASVNACRAASAKIDGRKNDPDAAVEFNQALGIEATNVGIDASAGSGTAASSVQGSAASNSTAGGSAQAVDGQNKMEGNGTKAAMGKQGERNKAAAKDEKKKCKDKGKDKAEANTEAKAKDVGAQGGMKGNGTEKAAGKEKSKKQDDKAAKKDCKEKMGDNASSDGAKGAGKAAEGTGAAADAKSGGKDDQNAASTADTGAGASANDFGSCSDPTVKFADGLDGRKEASFAPVDSADFTHGSALNLKVISDFICQQLQGKCEAGAAAVQRCNDAATKANALKGQAAADAFNAGVAG